MKSMASEMNRRHIFAIVRIDLFQLEDGAARDWANVVTVKGVVETQDQAASEVARLNEINAEKGCLYFWQAMPMLEPVERRGDG
jgi:hypothetical protein